MTTFTVVLYIDGRSLTSAGPYETVAEASAFAFHWFGVRSQGGQIDRFVIRDDTTGVHVVDAVLNPTGRELVAP